MATCEFDGCTNDATARVDAQWTLVDFWYYESCDDHVNLFFEAMQRRQVDGEFPVDVWITDYVTEEQAALVDWRREWELYGRY